MAVQESGMGKTIPASGGIGPTGPQALSAEHARRVVRKVQIWILPFLLVLYIVSVLDRVNIGFAALTMNRELAIGAEQFGLLSGIFFIGYLLFGVPSNIILHKLGARLWVSVILIAWGIVATCTGLARSLEQLYVLRFLLGIAEAGLFPGMILYLSYWFPSRQRAQAVALFMIAVPLASVLGAPVSGLILDHVRWLGIGGWRWLLILEGFPPVVLGGLALIALPNRPENAWFLNAQEKRWLASELAREEQATLAGRGRVSALGALRSGRVWYLCAIYFAMMIGLNTMNFWLPQVVRNLSSSYSNMVVGGLVMIPHACGLVAMILISRHSDRVQERRYHAAIPALIGGAALLFIAKTANPAAAIALFSLMGIGIEGFFGPFWSLPGEYLTGIGAASGIALINSVGNLGGFAGPYLLGVVARQSGSAQSGFVFAGVAMLAGGLLLLALVINFQRAT
jgi:MFS family permease